MDLQSKPPSEANEDSDVWVDIDGNLSNRVIAERGLSEIPNPVLVPVSGTLPELLGGLPFVNPLILPSTIRECRRYPERVRKPPDYY